MKIALLVFGFLVAGSALVWSQAGFTVKPKEFPVYQYQIFDVREVQPPISGNAVLPGAGTLGRSGSAPVSGSAPQLPNPIQRADRKFEDFCNEIGDKGYRLAQILPRNGGFRAIFEREIPPPPKK